MPSKKIYASPQDVETAFYEALERADLDGIMSVWAEDEDIVCVHPGGPRLVGYLLIREAWRRVFEQGARLTVRLSHQNVVATPFAAVLTSIEHISVRDDETLRAPVAVSNVFVRSALGWRMVLHHASPVPPESIPDGPKILH